MSERPTENRERFFWTTLVVSFVLLVHNGTEPLFLLAMALIPLVIGLFYYRPSLLPLAIYLLVFGALGRYTRYWRENYASDALLAIRDYIGYLLAGKNVYREMIMAQSGPTPFTYLPFSLLWYLPAQLFFLDLRFFEMFISALVPALMFLIVRARRTWQHLPIVAVVALTPFLLDLSADGSNDNSAIFLLLLSVLFWVYAHQKKVAWTLPLSAILLGFATSFKHYVWFYVIFFIPFLFKKQKLPAGSATRYFFYTIATVGLLNLPFILASPEGFWRSLFFIEIGNFHKIWGWNVWVGLRDAFGLIFTKQEMWLVRTFGTLLVILGLLRFFKLTSFPRVFAAASVSLLLYLILSDWTTYAYFTFLVPLMALAVISDT